MAVENNNRIIYVDPNDVYNITGRNGEDIQMAPPYEDFCIAFNLLVTNYDRFGDNSNKIAGKDSNGVEYQLSWVCGNSQAAFLKGDTFGIDNGDSYLTTYYTEIHAGNYGTKKIVEGLGVERIEVKFESWYTPTVNIKFVDVRGSSIFGNEEAIHTNGELTADNIFGCFFQIPYPLFKLQMKGFLGRPVTYQLTCSGCSHEYNASTGNFESNVTFIGYSYSLLTDIPFDYLVAAPHCPYIGIAYWNAHVNSREWALHDGSAPIKLSDFLNKIKSALNDGVGKGAGISEGDNATLITISGKKGLLSKIQSKLSNFVSQITNQAAHVIDATDEDGNRQLFLFMGKGRDRVTNADDTFDVSASQGTQNALTELTNAVKEYHDSYGTDGINERMLPNQKKALTHITANRILSINRNGDTITNMVFTALNGQERTFNNIKNIKFNDDKTVTDSIAKALYDGTTPNSYNTNFTEFAYVVDLYNLAHKVNELTDAATKEEESITRRVASKIEDNIEELVGCKPYIGNIFKMIMCHLETFLHIIFEAGQEIKEQERNGNRSPSALGIHDINTETDIPRGRSETVPPWPGVLNHKSANTEGDTDSSLDTLAWVGDFSHNFIEENVILSLQSAILHIVDSVHNTNTTVSTDYLPISAVDFLTGTSPFDSVTNEIEAGPSAVAGLVSLRAAILMGIMCNDSVAEKFAETFGKFDAYNCYASQTASLIDAMLIKPIEGQNGAETLIDIATCSTNGDTFASMESGNAKKSHDFETAQKIKDSYNRNGRHPMMLAGSDSYTYIHYYDGNGNSIVPSTLLPFSEYATRGIIKQRGDDPTNYSFSPLFKDDGKTTQSWAYLCNSNSILSDDEYANESMFSVFTDKSMVDGIIDYYDRLCDGHVDIVDTGCDGDFGDFTKTFLKVDDESYSKWFSKTTSLTPKRKDMGVDEKYLLPLSSDGDAPRTFQLNIIYDTDNANKRVVKANTDGTFKTSIDDTPRNADELTIPYFPINHIGVEGNLFGCPFYYIQTKSITASEDDNARNRRAKRVKALLFLHTLKYDYSKVPNVFKDTKTNGCMESIPYGMLLMFGGLLWRSRYIKENGRDPIVYNAEKMSLNYLPATKNNLAEEYTLFHKEDGCYNFSAQTNGSTYNYNVSVASLFGKGNDAGNRDKWWPDTNIANRLITVFEDFVDSDFNTIRNAFEIHDRNGNTYTSKSIVDFMKIFVGYVRGTNAHYDTTFNWLKGKTDNDADISNDFFGKYRVLTITRDSSQASKNDLILQMLTEESHEATKACVGLYTKKAIIADLCYKRLGQTSETNVEVKVSARAYKTYMTSFVSTLTNIIRGIQDNVTEINDSGGNGGEKNKFNRDNSIAMYYYIKSLWDRWLLPYESDPSLYNVDLYFKRFTFIDQFYRNTFKELKINCEVFSDIYNGLSENSSLFTFLDALISKHHCILFATPDYIGFTGEGGTDIPLMEDLFKAQPFVEAFGPKSETNNPETDNKFVIIYTNKPSEIIDERSGYKDDKFDIWSTQKGTDEAPNVFKTKAFEEGTDYMTRYGYNVPSFGVAMNRQYNHIFKGIKLNMNNPVVTDMAIRTYEEILTKGNSDARKVVFMGQDTYPIFSSYSYICEVTMIGNAQICPLMYFQLLNMPMWRGTYMIFNVTHTMTPGDMTTTFSGMKLSSRVMEYATTFFIEKDERAGISDSSSGDYGNIRGNVVTATEKLGLQDSYGKISEYREDHWGQSENKESINENGVQQSLRALYNCLFEEIQDLSENRETPKWNLKISSAVRTDNSGSDHYDGHAMDLKVMFYDKNGKNPQARGADSYDQSYLVKAMDILYTNHKEQVRQVILEYYNMNTMVTNPSFYHVLHVAVVRNANDKHEFWVGAYDACGAKHYTFINKCKGAAWWLDYATADFRLIAKKAYTNDKAFFNKYFMNYVGMKYTEEQLTAHFGLDTTPVAQNPSSGNDRIKVVIAELKKEFKDAQAVGICANMMRESSLPTVLNPKATNPANAAKDTVSARGICQWRGDRQKNVIDLLNQDQHTDYDDVIDFSLAQQVRGAILEMQSKTDSLAHTAYVNIQKMNNSKDVADEFLKNFERPGKDSKVVAKEQNKNYENIETINRVMGWS